MDERQQLLSDLRHVFQPGADVSITETVEQRELRWAAQAGLMRQTQRLLFPTSSPRYLVAEACEFDAFDKQGQVLPSGRWAGDVRQITSEERFRIGNSNALATAVGCETVIMPTVTNAIQIVDSSHDDLAITLPFSRRLSTLNWPGGNIPGELLLYCRTWDGTTLDDFQTITRQEWFTESGQNLFPRLGFGTVTRQPISLSAFARGLNQTAHPGDECWVRIPIKPILGSDNAAVRLRVPVGGQRARDLARSLEGKLFLNHWPMWNQILQSFDPAPIQDVSLETTLMLDVPDIEVPTDEDLTVIQCLNWRNQQIYEDARFSGNAARCVRVKRLERRWELRLPVGIKSEWTVRCLVPSDWNRVDWTIPQNLRSNRQTTARLAAPPILDVDLPTWMRTARWGQSNETSVLTAAQLQHVILKLMPAPLRRALDWNRLQQQQERFRRCVMTLIPVRRYHSDQSSQFNFPTAVSPDQATRQHTLEHSSAEAMQRAGQVELLHIMELPISGAISSLKGYVAWLEQMIELSYGQRFKLELVSNSNQE